MLTFIHGDETVGYYAAAIKSIGVARTLVTAVSAVFLPRLSYYFSRRENDEFNALANKGVAVITYLTIPAALGMFLVADDLVPIVFGIDFVQSITATKILAVSIISVALSNFFGSQILVTVGKEKKMFMSTVIGAAINIVFNFALIFSLKHNGVAIASAITELSVTAYQLYAVRNEIKFGSFKKHILTILFAAFGMAVSIVLCKKTIVLQPLRLVLSVVCGASVYFAMTILLKNEFALRCVSRFKHIG